LIKATGRENNSVNNQFWTDPTQTSNPNANNCRTYQQRYEYDQVGNIQKLIHAASGNNFTRKYVYAANTNINTQINDGQSSPTTLADYQYDIVGNQTNANSDRQCSWDAVGGLKLFKITASGSVSQYAHYVYDAGGQRAKKIVIKQNGDYESVTYLDGVLEYRKKVTNNGGTIQQKNYLQLQGGIEIRIGSYTGDMPETEVYTLSDHLGSAGTRLDYQGSNIDKEEYYPYGDSSLRTFGSKRYRYCGKEKDEESGLYYMAARYYCSSSAKFLSVDPLAGKYAHQSSYCYADCNPIMKNDPSGMGAVVAGDSGGGGSSTQPNANQTGGSAGGGSGTPQHNWENSTRQWETRNSDGTLTGQPASPKELPPVEIVRPKSSISEKAVGGATSFLKGVFIGIAIGAVGGYVIGAVIGVVGAFVSPVAASVVGFSLLAFGFYSIYKSAEQIYKGESGGKKMSTNERLEATGQILGELVGGGLTVRRGYNAGKKAVDIPEPNLRGIGEGSPGSQTSLPSSNYQSQSAITPKGNNVPSFTNLEAANGGVQAGKVSGSYLLEFQSGKFYVGKGLEPRMMQSINRIETNFGDKLVNKSFLEASSTREAFIQEYKFMLQTKQVPLHWNKNSLLYNKIWSPGKKLMGH